MTKIGNSTKVTAVTLLAVLAFAVAVTALDPGGAHTGGKTKPGDRVWMQAGSSAGSVTVRYLVRSSTRGTLDESPSLGQMERSFLRDYYLSPGETVSISLEAGVAYSGTARTVDCVIRSDIGGEVASDRSVKRMVGGFPDVRCEGSVTSRS
jgi:hypothetical protein